jgi:ribosome-binding factor A
VRHQSHTGQRTNRIADFIRDEVALILQQQMRDPRIGLLSVNEVLVSKDLSYADIYIASLQPMDAEGRQAMIATLNGASGWVRSELAKRHSMRTTPKPRFHYDEVVETGPRLERLIEQAVASDANRHQGEPDDEQT